MANKIVYIKADRNTEVSKNDVYLKDIASVTCSDQHILAKVKALRVVKFREHEEKRAVVSILKIIEMIEELDETITVENVGETDLLIELVRVDKEKGPAQWIKLGFVSCISFFGTAFTIMAFHNDIGIHEVFEKIYELIVGKPSNGFTVLEAAYSVGLASGIIVFFNHIGGRRITKDPTPIEVEMRTYEKDVDDTLIETAEREGKSIDVS